MKASKIEELQSKLTELENELEDAKFENNELAKVSKVPSISQSRSSVRSREISQKSVSGKELEPLKLRSYNRQIIYFVGRRAAWVRCGQSEDLIGR